VRGTRVRSDTAPGAADEAGPEEGGNMQTGGDAGTGPTWAGPCCLLCHAHVGAEHIAEHFAQCFDEHCPVDSAPAADDTSELTQPHSAAVRRETEEADAREVALFDESLLGGPIPSFVVTRILQALDMPSLGQLGRVTRGWERASRAHCRVRCAYKASKLAGLLPARHVQLASDYLGRTHDEQCRCVCQLERQSAHARCAAQVTIYVKSFNGKRIWWRVRCTPAAAVNNAPAPLGVLGVICLGDLCYLIQDKSGVPAGEQLLVDTSTCRRAVHWDVPLAFCAVPRRSCNEVYIEFDLLLATSVNGPERHGIDAFEAFEAARARADSIGRKCRAAISDCQQHGEGGDHGVADNRARGGRARAPMQWQRTVTTRGVPTDVKRPWVPGCPWMLSAQCDRG
jgi:hypothetical protein